MSRETWNIQEASRDDVLLLGSLIRESFAEVAAQLGRTAENCPSHPAFITPEAIREAFAKGTRFFILESGGAACGCVGLTLPRDGACDLVRLAVMPGHRRKGFGEALVRHVLHLAWMIGVRHVRLSMIFKNEPLRLWYQRLGFSVTGIRQPPHLTFEVADMAMNMTQCPVPVSQRACEYIRKGVAP
jgi:ribosomal protein S18 acetylase RimI-like enzyme